MTSPSTPPANAATNASAPPTEVLEAFGASGDELTQLPGGQRTSWRAGDVVLKPSTDAPQIEWLADSVERVADTDAFRMARHLPAADGRWVVDGWAATTWVDGAHAAERWDDTLAVSSAFHAAIASVAVPAGRVPAADNQWRRADRMAWGETPIPDGAPAVIDRVRAALAEAWAGAPAQVTHIDIAGNVLFADGLPPAVIDVSPYARPPAYPNAVAVADLMAWHGAPLTLAIRFAATTEGGENLLARSVAFRVLTAMEAWAAFPERVAAEADAYTPVLSALST